MPTEFSVENVNDYFTKLNPIAMKISFDIDETKSAYGHIWEKLNTNEHNEIINETLMKPEISLRYFDNFSITTTASSLSLSSMVTPSQNEEPAKRPASQPNHHYLDTRRYYDFDGRNLSTFSDQKVGLKLVHDETFGTFRDGHSMPFSYKTKSQINLKLFADEGADLMRSSQIKSTGISEALQKPLPKKSDEPKVCTTAADSEVLQISAEALKKLQTELASNLLNRNKSESTPENTTNITQGLKSFDNIDAKYQRFYDDSKDSEIDNLPVSSNNEMNLRKLIAKNGKSIATKFHHSKYGYNDTTDDDDEFERVNLMMNCCSLSAGGMTTSSSSAPSEDDEKTLCEDLKGLLENDGLRKGFDFLNNW
ncbi:uncharacterized protein LOC129949626 [Eupeodes corollae]|uniref:uncharacterized protein LOC129949626 n=1 Tax=Eupeodes corollae TaxID=290404 RepID=UPI00249170C8|nr:uncharacterized protein LOC129949626 [Eupeodes corollae]